MRPASLAIFLAALAACDSPDAPPEPVAVQCAPGAVLACPGGWATCSAAGELGGCVLSPAPSASAPEPDASAPPDVAVCGPAVISTQALGADCEPLPDVCACGGVVRYRCASPDAFTQPATGLLLGGQPIPGGCRTVVQGNDVRLPTEHCCAPACVRHASRDGQCDPGHPAAYACAPGVVAPTGCVGTGAELCCGN